MKTYPWIAVSFSSILISIFPRISLAASPAECGRIYQQARDFHLSGQILIGAHQFALLSALDCPASINRHSRLGLGISLAQLGEANAAQSALTPLLSDPDFARSARIASTVLLSQDAQNLAATDQARWQIWKSRHSLQPLEISQLAPIPDPIRTEAQAILQERAQLPQKSASIAAFSSALIPGSGQLYSGALQSAAMAFLINSLFLATTVEFARKDMPAAAAASGLVFSITYLGNIINAAQSAKRVNQGRLAPSESRLRKVLFPELEPAALPESIRREH